MEGLRESIELTDKGSRNGHRLVGGDALVELLVGKRDVSPLLGMHRGYIYGFCGGEEPTEQLPYELRMPRGLQDLDADLPNAEKRSGV